MIPIPELTDADVVFSNIDHLPKWEAIPDEFKERDEAHAEVVSKWFFEGLSEEDVKRLKPRKGVDLIVTGKHQHKKQKIGRAHV